MNWPNPWQSMEPWRRMLLGVLGAVVVVAYAARVSWTSTDRVSRVVVVVASLAALLVWGSRPRP